MGYMDSLNGSFTPPYTSSQIQWAQSAYAPNSVRVDSLTRRYFQRDLFQRVAYFLDWQNLPETWDKAYLNFCLAWCGYCGVIDAEKFGVIPQWGTLSGWGIYCQPNMLSVVNKYFDMPLMLIGEECELLKMTPDYMGIWDIIDYFSVKLAMVSRDFDMSAINSTVSYAVAAKNKAAANTIKAIFDQAQRGEPLVVYDQKALLPNDGENEQPWQMLTRDVHDGLILQECQDAIFNLYHSFDTVMGIPYASTAKKERTLTVEAEATQGETQSRVQDFIDNLKRSCDRVNKMYGMNIGIRMRGVNENANASSNASESDAE